MSALKEVGNLDGGTASVVGGSDWDTLVGYYKGKPNQFSPTIDSDTTYKFGRLFLRNQSDSASINIRAGATTGSFAYTFPPYNANDDILLAGAPQAITNKTIDFSLNTIIGGGTGGGSGSSTADKKWGLIQAPKNAIDGTVSQGTLAGHINVGTPINDNDPPPAGTHWQYDTGTTSNTNAGIRWASTWIRRDFNPRLKVKYRIPVSATGHQFLFGLSVDVDIDSTQAALLDTQSGILVGYRSTDANYVVIRNGGTNAQTVTPTVDDTASTSVVSKSASVYRTAEIAFTNAGGTCTVTIQNIALTAPYAASTIFTKQYTTNLPAITSPGTGGSIYLRPVMQVTNKEAVNHSLELFKMELDTDF